MRVISGLRRGHKLLSFDGDYIRPTTDRVKESMFNLIQGRCEGAVAFDAFSGSGALGIEALSRGAKSVSCTDTDSRSVKLLKKNYESCGFSDKLEVFEMSAEKYLLHTDKHFDIVFLDPPYNKGLVTPVLRILFERRLLRCGGSIVIERDGIEDSFELSGFEIEKERSYGRTVITVLK